MRGVGGGSGVFTDKTVDFNLPALYLTSLSSNLCKINRNRSTCRILKPKRLIFSSTGAQSLDI
ncbi:unnamed protein product [Ectocarpus sp. 8 AP-2014]